MKINYLIFITFIMLLGISYTSFAQVDNHQYLKKDATHKKMKKQKETKQTPEKRKELLQRTLKEKNFHIPDTSKHR